MEHTGIYNAISLEVFFRKGVKVCLEPALQIKQSLGMVRGKNDRIDAKRIALYAYKNKKELRLWRPLRSVIQQLQGLLTLRDRLIKAKVQLEVPLRESVGFLDPSIVKNLNAVTRASLKGIAQGLKMLEQKLKLLIDKDVAVKEQFRQATSVPGVGKVIAMNMIVITGEFQRIKQPKKFACHIGVAPFEYSSGSSIHGKTRVSKMANMTMKKLFHLGAMSAIQSSEEIRAFYNRKVAEGKNRMSVLNAVRNKLISRVYACVKNQRLYQKDYNHILA